jgi:hypothetical protein
VVSPFERSSDVINPTLHREIARQREVDFRRDAEQARRAAHVRRELPLLAGFTPALAAFEALGFLARRRPHPSI